MLMLRHDLQSPMSMIRALHIENFRLFRHLSVEGIGRVNLVVGRNNAGKSAFLEAVQVYADGASADLLLHLVRARQESWSRPYEEVQMRGEANPLRHLFWGHRFPPLGDGGIRLGGKGRLQSSIHITTGAFVREETEDGATRRVRVQDQDFFGHADAVDLEYALVLEDPSGWRWLIDLTRDPFRYQSRRRGRDSEVSVQSVPAGSLDPATIAQLWDRISLTEGETIVVEALRLLEPSITGVALVEDHSSRTKQRIPIIRSPEFDEPTPLSSMGDGMTRVFQLVLALVNAQGGILLLDEFENGLHWSVQKAVWEQVWRLSYSLDVQVFATSHSRDCIRAFSSIWSRSPAEGAFFRLERGTAGATRVRPYPPHALEDSLVSDVEMR